MAVYAKRERGVKKETLGKSILADIDTVLTANEMPSVDKLHIRGASYRIVIAYNDFLRRFYEVATHQQLRPLCVSTLLGSESFKDCIKRIEKVRKAIHHLNTHKSFATIRENYLKHFENDI